jgi:hypothetical protein
MSAVLALVQLVTNANGQTVNKPIGNGVNTTIVNPYAPRAQIITGPTAPSSLSGLVDGWDGQVIEIVNLSGQQMTINHLDPAETIAANQFMCSNGPPGLTLASAPGGFSWVRVSYSGSKSKWLVLDHSCWEFDDDGLMRRRKQATTTCRSRRKTANSCGPPDRVRPVIQA